jgi:hypothetical protein
MLVSMPRIRRRATALLLAYLALGFIASFRAGHTGSGSPLAAATPAGHCGSGGSMDPGGAPNDGTAPDDAKPCQWATPLLCCQQVVTADSGNVGPVADGALLVRSLAPSHLALIFVAHQRPAALSAPRSTSYERSAILQL